MEIIVLLVIAGCIYWLYKNRATGPSEQNYWARKFAVYYVNDSLCLYSLGTGDIPEELVGSLEARVPGRVAQSFIVSLGNYLRQECGRNMQHGDYPLALTETRKLLSANIQWANTHAALGPYIRAIHKEETGNDITESELAAHREEIIKQVEADEEAAAMMTGQILRFNIEAMFKEMFGVRYYDYLEARYPNQPLTSPLKAM